jgi:hypothetical protein
MTTDTAVEPTPAAGSRWEDLVDIFFSPSELYARRAHDSWLKPLLLLIAISIVLYYVFLPINALVWEAAMIENAPAGADVERMRQSAQFMKYLGGVFVPVGYGFIILVTALGLKFGSALLEPAAKWREAFLIATYSMFVAIPQQVLGALLVFIKSRSGAVEMRDASFGALRFVEQPDAFLSAVLGRLDLFPIWSAILCAIGLIVIVRMPRAKAFAVAAIAWLLIAIPALASAALFGQK